jgi:hypothetical protein
MLFEDAAIRTAAQSAATDNPATPPCAILTTNGSMSVAPTIAARAALKALGYEKWKSCGLIRYRGLQLAARSDGSHAVTFTRNSNLRDEEDRQRTGKNRSILEKSSK